MDNSFNSAEKLNSYYEDDLDFDEETLEFLDELDEDNGAGILFTLGIFLAVIGFIFLMVSLAFWMILETSSYEDGYQDATVLVSPSTTFNVVISSLFFIEIGTIFIYFNIKHEEHKNVLLKWNNENRKYNTE